LGRGADSSRPARIQNSPVDHDVIPVGGARRRGAPWSVATSILVAGVLARLIVAVLLPALPDEAYYWDWSRHLAAGYFDHPPAIALLIRLGGALLSPIGAAATTLGVRLGPLAAGFVAAVATVAVARRLAGEHAAVRAALVITCMPLAAAGLILATPDAPLLAATAIGCYAVVRALEAASRSRESLVWWTMAGGALGLAFSSKYTSILLPAGVFIALVVRPSLRARLREPGPYVAAIVATVVFAPVLFWNARHDMISFTYQVRHGLVSSAGIDMVGALKREGDYLGGQVGLVSPILFVLMVLVVSRGLRGSSSDARFVLATIATLTFGLFAYSALRRRVEPNWPAPGYIAAIALLATEPWTPRVELSAVIYAQGVAPILPIAPRRDPVARAFGWRELTARVDAAMRSATAVTGARSWSGGDRYQEAAEIALHDETHPPTFAMNLAGRANQYDLWPRFADRASPGDNLVLALDESDPPHPTATALSVYFREMRRGELVTLRRRTGDVGVRRIWILVDWRGQWPRSPGP
jgi:hypothetical protein